jgi:hypothetical protein
LVAALSITAMNNLVQTLHDFCFWHVRQSPFALVTYVIFGGVKEQERAHVITSFAAFIEVIIDKDVIKV